MPPRTGPRRKRRPRAGAPRHFAIVRDDTSGAGYSVRTELAVAHHIELDNGHLVLRDQAGAIIQVIAAGEWREIRPTTIGDIPYADEAGNPAVTSGTGDSDKLDSMQREEATLDPPAAGIQAAPIREDDRRFVPSSPEEAQRILMELERRLKSPESNGSADAPPPTRKD